MKLRKKKLFVLIFSMIVLHERLIDNSGDRFAGCPVKNSDENRNNRKAFGLE